MIFIDFLCIPSTGNTDRTHNKEQKQNAIKLSYLSGICGPSSDIRGNITLLRGSFALCPSVFQTCLINELYLKCLTTLISG